MTPEQSRAQLKNMVIALASGDNAKAEEIHKEVLQAKMQALVQGGVPSQELEPVVEPTEEGDVEPVNTDPSTTEAEE